MSLGKWVADGKVGRRLRIIHSLCRQSLAKHSEVPVRTKPNRLEPRRPTRAYITKA